MALRAAWLDDAVELEAVAGEWQALVGDAPPWEQPGWFGHWWSAFGRGRLAILTVRDGGSLTGILPLSRDRRHLRSLANAHTPSFRPLARDAQSLSRLIGVALGAAPLIELHGLPLGDPAVATLRAGASAARMRSLTEDRYASPVTDTRGEFESYRRRMRRGWIEIERRGRKLRREHEVQLRAVVGDIADLDEGLRLEAAGWKGRSGTAMLGSPGTAAFYRAVARDAARAGTLRCSALRVDGRLVAFDLAFVAGGRYLLLKTAYDESMRSLSPGLVLRRAVIERCFELGLESHEFLGKDAPWKQLFSTGAREHGSLRLYARSPMSLAGLAYRRSLRPRVREMALRAGYRPGSLPGSRTG